MTVRKLIKILESYSPDLEVCIPEDYHAGNMTVLKRDYIEEVKVLPISKNTLKHWERECNVSYKRFKNETPVKKLYLAK